MDDENEIFDNSNDLPVPGGPVEIPVDFVEQAKDVTTLGEAFLFLDRMKTRTRMFEKLLQAKGLTIMDQGGIDEIPLGGEWALRKESKKTTKFDHKVLYDAYSVPERAREVLTSNPSWLMTQLRADGFGSKRDTEKDPNIVAAWEDFFDDRVKMVSLVNKKFAKKKNQKKIENEAK